MDAENNRLPHLALLLVLVALPKAVSAEDGAQKLVVKVAFFSFICAVSFTVSEGEKPCVPWAVFDWPSSLFPLPSA